MRSLLYAAAVLAGAVLALLGDQPLWFLAVIALLVFPFAAAGAVQAKAEPGGPRPVPLLPAALVAGTGGLLVALALRLAVDAPGWLSPIAADCGGPSTSTQQLVLWIAAVAFAAASLPVGATLLTVGRRLARPGSSEGSASPLGLYPVAVAAAALALVAASFVTTC